MAEIVHSSAGRYQLPGIDSPGRYRVLESVSVNTATC